MVPLTLVVMVIRGLIIQPLSLIALTRGSYLLDFFVDNGGGEYGMAIGECLEEHNVWGCWGYGWDGC
jgi:hypothetical protein